MKPQKTNLTKAYDRLRELNLETNSEQYIELSNILYDLANEQFDKGIDVASGIYTKNKQKQPLNLERRHKHKEFKQIGESSLVLLNLG